MSNSSNELEIFREAVRIAVSIWNHVVRADYLSKQAVGQQLIHSADAIAANLPRNHAHLDIKDRLNSCLLSQTSLLETQVWLEMAAGCNLIDSGQAQVIYYDLVGLKKRLHSHIQTISSKSDSRDF